MKILIAEDDITSRTILRAFLTQWDFDVIAAGDGQEAWDIMQKEASLQLAILDWMMPGMNGPDLCRKLREQTRRQSLYLILLTSKKDRGDIIHGLEAGANDYISKPYDKEELRARVEVGRRLIRLQNELQEREKLQGVLEMAGAVCHELNQPLQAVSGYSELLLMDLEPDNPKCDTIKKLKEGVDRIAELTNRIMNITHYQSKSYLKRKLLILNRHPEKGRGDPAREFPHKTLPGGQAP